MNVSLPSFFFCNARSILPKMDDLLSHVSTFAPDCVAISETWLTINNNDDFLRIPTYDFFRCDRKSRRGGGVCIWTKHWAVCTVVKLEYLLTSIYFSYAQLSKYQVNTNKIPTGKAGAGPAPACRRRAGKGKVDGFSTPARRRHAGMVPS